MTPFVPQLWFLLPLISLVLLLTGAKLRRKHHPPGPPKLPFIGNLHQLGSVPHRSLRNLSKQYGPVMFLQLGTVPTLVISSAEAAKQVLKDHDQDCCGRAASAGTARLSYNRMDMAFAPYDHQWREMRRLLTVELFSARKVRLFRRIREEEVCSMVQSIARSAAGPRPVDLSEMVFELNASVIFKTAFGRAFEIDTEKLHEVAAETEAVMGCFFASDFFPCAGRVFDRLSGLHGKLERCFREMDEFYEYVIGDHLDSSRAKPEQEDIVDVLLRIEGEGKEPGAAKFTRHHTKAMLMNVFLAGVTSSAIVVTWAMAELAKNPRVMRKAQIEVRDRVGKKGKVSEGDIDGLEYLKMVLKETLRLHPPLPLLISREVTSRFKLNNYDVPPKTRVEINAWAIGRDPNTWNNPEEFYPERFTDSSIDYKGNHFELLPFGAGRRGCPGMYMGMVITELVLANLLYCFDWKLPSGMKEEDIDMEEQPGLLTPTKSPLELVPVRVEWP